MPILEIYGWHDANEFVVPRDEDLAFNRVSIE